MFLQALDFMLVDWGRVFGWLPSHFVPFLALPVTTEGKGTAGPGNITHLELYGEGIE